MTTTIDGAGWIVLPKAVRQQLKLSPGTAVEIRCWDGVIEIEPAPLPVTLRRRGRLTVAVPEQPVPPLTEAAVESARQRLRRDRGAE